MENGRGLIKALENWAKKITSGYRDVEVRDLSTSFRDGMAFCAIIHHYRPDLIDFDSLAKAHILENNSLAFGVAEKQLGVPALLDAEDMVKYERPDRLSIITYLSQLRNCFENQNKVKLKTELKRVKETSPGPPAKVATPSLMAVKRHEVCQVCKHRVFILERLIVDGKLYHTTCFRCHKCDCLLNPGAYVESDIVGIYECSVCLADEVPDTPKPASTQINIPVTQIYTPQPLPQKEFTKNEAVTFARSNLSPDSSLASLYSSEGDSSTNTEGKNVSASSVSVKDKIHAFEKSQPGETPPSTTSAPVPQIRRSLVLNSSNEPSSKVIYAQPMLSSDEKRNPLTTLSSLQNLASPEKPSSEKKCIHSVTKDCDKSFRQENDFTDEVPIKETSDVNSSDKNIYLTKTVTESPKVSRDIFKTSLPPLKLPSTIRKEGLVVPGKTFDIPSLQSTSPLSLSYMRRNLSFSKDPSTDAISQNNSNLANDVLLQNQNKIRRNSLESSECDNINKNISNENFSKSDFKTFNRTVSVQEMSLNVASKNFRTSPLRTYTPLYTSVLHTSNNVKQEDEAKNHMNAKTSLSDSFKTQSENSLENDVESKNQSKIRRNSLESGEGNNTKNIFKENFSQLGFKTFNRTVSEQEASSNLAFKNFRTSPLRTSSPTSILPASNNIKQEDEAKGDIDAKTSLSGSLKTQSKTDFDLFEKLNSDTSKISAPKISVSNIKNNTNEEEYPDDLNPFDEVDDTTKNEEYPDDLNPFGDEDETNDSHISEVEYDEAKNPFASDTDEDCPPSPPKAPPLEAKSFSDSIRSNVSSPSSSLKGTLKKRPAPKPPALSDIFPKDSVLDSSLKSSPSSVKKPLQASSPKIRKNKPAPPPPQDCAKMNKETDNQKLKSSKVDTPKKKKRPAPPVPIPMRRDMKKIPLKEILQEMKEIEEKQREYERQGRYIELLIRDKDKDDEASVEEEEYIMQLFELVNQKNALFRRQAELMYIKRSQKLEEQQYQIEKEIRNLMQKPESEKTEEDRQKEEELTLELIDIVDQRNSIIDSIEMDRRRELEEDHSVQEQLEIKNGDLQIPAEIKQKSSGKHKKSKAKKEKKKQEEQEGGKGTMKRKKLFSRKS